MSKSEGDTYQLDEASTIVVSIIRPWIELFSVYQTTWLVINLGEEHCHLEFGTNASSSAGISHDYLVVVVWGLSVPIDSQGTLKLIPGNHSLGAADRHQNQGKAYENSSHPPFNTLLFHLNLKRIETIKNIPHKPRCSPFT